MKKVFSSGFKCLPSFHVRRADCELNVKSEVCAGGILTSRSPRDNEGCHLLMKKVLLTDLGVRM